MSTPRNASSQPEHLDHRARGPQHVHHRGRDLLVGLPVHRQEHRVGRRAEPPRGGAQRQPRVHAVLAGLVRRRADHAPLGRVAVAAHHHRPPAQLGVAQHLDRRDELVEVHVQHPAPHASTFYPTRPRRIVRACTARPPPADAPPGPPRPRRHHRHGALGLQRPAGRRASLNSCSLPARITDPRSTPTHVIFRMSII